MCEFLSAQEEWSSADLGLDSDLRVAPAPLLSPRLLCAEQHVPVRIVPSAWLNRVA